MTRSLATDAAAAFLLSGCAAFDINDDADHTLMSTVGHSPPSDDRNVICGFSGRMRSDLFAQQIR